MFNSMKKTGTRMVEEIVGKFESTIRALEEGTNLIIGEMTLNEVQIRALNEKNTALELTRQKANRVEVALRNILGEEE